MDQAMAGGSAISGAGQAAYTALKAAAQVA